MDVMLYSDVIALGAWYEPKIVVVLFSIFLGIEFFFVTLIWISLQFQMEVI